MADPDPLSKQSEDAEAPLGYAAVGCADDMSPYSERSTPPYLEWARDLHYVLEDYEGTLPLNALFHLNF